MATRHRCRFFASLALFAVLVVFVPAMSRAQTPPSIGAPTLEPPSLAPATDAIPLPAPDPATLPTFRGRGDRVTAGEALLWIPRVLFFPLYALTEYGLRVPVYAGTSWAVNHHVPARLHQILDPSPHFAWEPTFLVDLGLLASVGLRLEWKNALVHGHDVSASTTTGGTHFWHLTLRDHWQLGIAYIDATASYLTRPDQRFYGFGPNTENSDETFYRIERAEALGHAGFRATYHFSAELSGGYRYENTSPGLAPSIETRYSANSIPGFGLVRLGVVAAHVVVDTRTRASDETGIRLDATGTYAEDTNDLERRFFAGALTLDAALEVARPGRVLALTLYVADTAPLGSEDVPFVEQPSLGGDQHMAFYWGRFRGESAVLAEARYRYPIAYYVDATLLASVGNVFSRTFSDFDFRALTTSLAVGVRTRSLANGSIEALVGIGTGRFDEAFEIQSVRVYLKFNQGL